jgi:Flp pilus assembly pilin Flp
MKNERGIAIIEYALLLGMLAVAVYGVINWTSIGTAIAAVIADIVALINPA